MRDVSFLRSLGGRQRANLRGVPSVTHVTCSPPGLPRPCSASSRRHEPRRPQGRVDRHDLLRVRRAALCVPCVCAAQALSSALRLRQVAGRRREPLQKHHDRAVRRPRHRGAQRHDAAALLRVTTVSDPGVPSRAAAPWPLASLTASACHLLRRWCCTPLKASVLAEKSFERKCISFFLDVGHRRPRR